MSINLSKAQSLTLTLLGDSIGVQVLYKSQQRRGFTYGPDELGLGDLVVAARKAGVTIIGLCDRCEASFPTTSIFHVDTPLALCDTCAAEAQSDPAPESPNALAAMLALTPEQTKHLEGAERLNFWRNGSLNVQVQHGCRATKVKLPNTVVTDVQLDEFFAAWGWQKIGQKPYYRPTAASLVRI